ncbi:hypothetical protein ACJMK2_011569 [Sinanodonta woodiana]|uniref:AIP/AIPL N-terminal FKBP-type PPIase domain-containing protein n=1 Tax=Sinanodonta woodiana TaxID=1069815 RepID=A0ABD3V8H3_SINWO
MADVIFNLQALGIRKTILHGAPGSSPDYQDGTKLIFHYKTTKCDDERSVIDDSRKHERPMELVLGKKFKLEIWETLLKTMKPKEVAEFWVDKKLVDMYPIVSKSLRDIFLKKKNHSHDHEHDKPHCCGMMALAEKGIGHDDLDELIKNPQPLIFILELIRVEEPGSYEKDAWQMSDEEKVATVPKLREEGNALYGNKKYKEAEEKYALAIGILEQLIIKEKPGDEEWNKLEDIKLPLLLNYSQCKLLLEDYYPVIEHTTTVLKRDPDNVKALYRRAKAHVGAWNPEDARKDFERILQIDTKLASAVKKELKLLEDKQKAKDEEDKQKLQGMFS